MGSSEEEKEKDSIQKSGIFRVLWHAKELMQAMPCLFVCFSSITL